MSTLAELLELVGFFSYSREDDEGSFGRLSKLRERIQEELRAQLGRTKKDFRLWQDKFAIPHGEPWEKSIKDAINESAFFIPIVTPTAVRSHHCKFEFDSFLEREKQLGRNNLVFPIHYIPVSALTDGRWHHDPLLKIIGSRQYEPWQDLRHLDASSPEVALRIEAFCSNICKALQQPWVSPEECEARRQAEAEAKRRAEEERAEAEAKRRAEEERAEAEAKRRAEEERSRQEAEAKRLAEQGEAFAAAKRADDIGTLDAFLANHPESRHTVEARTLREALLARDEACKAAMASDDSAVLKAFLRTYPKGPRAEQVRGRLRSLEPQTAFGRAAAVFLLVLLAGAAGLWLYEGGRGVPEEKARQIPEEKARQKRVEPDQATRRCTDAQQLRDTFTDFTLVLDSMTYEKPTEYYDILSFGSPLEAANDCGASCRARNWCKAFEVRSRGCYMYTDINTLPTNSCYYWFRRK